MVIISAVGTCRICNIGYAMNPAFWDRSLSPLLVIFPYNNYEYLNKNTHTWLN